MTLTLSEVGLLKAMLNKTLADPQSKENKSLHELQEKLDKMEKVRIKKEFKGLEPEFRERYKCWLFTEQFAQPAYVEARLMWPELDPTAPHLLKTKSKGMTHCILEDKSTGNFYYGVALCDARDKFDHRKGEQRALGMAKKAIAHEAFINPMMSFIGKDKDNTEKVFLIKDQKTTEEKSRFFHGFVRAMRRLHQPA